MRRPGRVHAVRAADVRRLVRSPRGRALIALVVVHGILEAALAEKPLPPPTKQVPRPPKDKMIGSSTTKTPSR